MFRNRLVVLAGIACVCSCTQVELADSAESNEPPATKMLSERFVSNPAQASNELISKPEPHESGDGLSPSQQHTESYVEATPSKSTASEEKDKRRFNSLMTTAHDLIVKERFAEAQRTLDEALKLDPNSVAAQELRIFTTQRLVQIRFDRFHTAMQEERWEDAASIAKALHNESASFKAAAQRSVALIEIEALADRLIDNPNSLSHPSIQVEVSKVQAAGKRLDVGERIAQKISRLNELSDLWTTPIVLQLNSDGRTDVILRPGKKLGKFFERKIELMPGEYRLIGRRNGFHEVNRELLLQPQDSALTVEIRATERF